MELPEHADPQAEKFFRSQYSTSNRPVDSARHWNGEHPDLVPTKTVRIGCQERCIYCGSQAYPIYRSFYNELTHTNFCCICPSAFLEFKVSAEILAAEQAHNKLCNDLKKLYPKVNIKALVAVKKAALDFEANSLTIHDLKDK